MPTPILHTEGVCKSFGDHVALAPLDVDVQQGRIVGLLGPNGAGKTTLLRMVTGITKPDAGTLRMWGQPHHRSLLSRMGYLPEERGLYKSMRVAEQVLYFAGLRGMDRQEAERELKGWFERLEVEGWWNREVSDLSKGMAQKIQFIATVLHRPELLILDEPFSGLDPINAGLVRNRDAQDGPGAGHDACALHARHGLGGDAVRRGHPSAQRPKGPRRRHRRRSGRCPRRSHPTQGPRQPHGVRGRARRPSRTPDQGNRRNWSGRRRAHLELALPSDWPMPAFLKWAVEHVEVLEAQPRRLSMEEVFVQSVESAQA